MPDANPTAVEVTDEQIRELHTALLDENIASILGANVRECKLALGLCFVRGTTPASPARKREARAHCAALITARRAQEVGR